MTKKNEQIGIRFRKGEDWVILTVDLEQFEGLIQTCNQYFYPEGPILNGPQVRSGVDLPTAAKTLGWTPQKLYYYLIRNRVQGARYTYGKINPNGREKGTWDIPLPVVILDHPHVPESDETK